LGSKANALVFVFILCPGTAVFLLALNPGIDFAWAPLNTQRWALSIFGWIFSGPLFVLFATVSVAWVRGFLSGDIRHPPALSTAADVKDRSASR